MHTFIKQASLNKTTSFQIIIIDLKQIIHLNPPYTYQIQPSDNSDQQNKYIIEIKYKIKINQIQHNNYSTHMHRYNSSSESSRSDSDGERNRRERRDNRHNPNRTDRQRMEERDQRIINRNYRQAWRETRRIAMSPTIPTCPHQPQIRISLLDPMLYINDKFSQQQALRRYRIFRSQDQGGIFRFIKEERVYIFDHKHEKIIMEDFVRYDWSDVAVMDLTNCRVSTEDWRVLSDYAHQFQKLQVLSLPKNEVEYVKSSQIRNFPKLRAINFGNKPSNENPLNEESTTELIQYTRQSKKPLILFNKQRYDNQND